MDTKLKVLVLMLFVLVSAMVFVTVAFTGLTIFEEPEEEDFHFVNINQFQELSLSEEPRESFKYPRFNNNTITYSLSGINDSQKRQRMQDALKELEKEVGEFIFVEVPDYQEADIKILFERRNNLRKIGEANLKLNILNEVSNAEIRMINVVEYCHYHNTETHELLHVFGFEHNSRTIMDPHGDNCYKLTDRGSRKYIEHLQFIYSDGLRGVEHSDIPMYNINELI